MKNKLFIFIYIVIYGLYSFANELLDFEKKSIELEKKRIEIQSAISDIENNQRHVLEKINVYKKNLNKKIRFIEQTSKHPLITLFAADDIHKNERSIKILRQITNKNLSELREYVYLQKDYESQKSYLKNYFSSLKKQLELIKTMNSQIVQAEKAVIDTINAKQNSSLLQFKGQLSLPITAKLKQRFGSIKINNSSSYIHSNGLVFSSRKGQSVHAIGPGKVIFSDVHKSWKHTVIIEHEGHYFSVYTGLTNCVFKTNETVKENELLGQTYGTEFYFELRHEDVPINPILWLKGL